MKYKILIWCIRILAVGPLIIGSIAFWIWKMLREFYCYSFDLQTIGIYTTIIFIIATILNFILMLIFLLGNWEEKKKLILPILTIPIAIFAISQYESIYQMMMEKAYVKIIDDINDGRNIDQISSNNFNEYVYLNGEKSYIISFTPVQNHDHDYLFSKTKRKEYKTLHSIVHIGKSFQATDDISGDYPPHLVYDLPEISAGACKIIKLSKLKINKELSDRSELK